MPPARPGVPTASFGATQELFRADGLTIASSSDSVAAATPNQIAGPQNLGPGVIDLSGMGSGLLIVRVTAVTGTTPTLNFGLQVQDAFGNWAPVPEPAGGMFGATPITAAGSYAAALSSAIIAGFVGKLTWTVGGTTPNFSGVFLDIFGR